MSEQELADAIIRHALDLQRLSAHEEAEAVRLLRLMEDDLKRLMNAETLSELRKRELNAVIAEAEKIIDAHYGSLAAGVDTHALMLAVAKNTADLLSAAFPRIATQPPSPERLASLSKEVLIDGAPTAAWWERQAEDTAQKFAGQVRQGVVNGETNERIVQRIVGRKPRGDVPGEPGIMETTRRNARALVHSSIMQAANDSRYATFKKMARFALGVQWLATLDGITCPICVALDGEMWDFDGAPIKGATIEWQGTPPKHWSCRCVLTLVPKRDALEAAMPGITEELEARGGRASSLGPTGADTSMTGYLRRAPRAQVEEQLGKGRADMFLAGKLTLRDLVTGTGRPLTLKELQSR